MEINIGILKQDRYQVMHNTLLKCISTYLTCTVNNCVFKVYSTICCVHKLVCHTKQRVLNIVHNIFLLILRVDLGNYSMVTKILNTSRYGVLVTTENNNKKLYTVITMQLLND